MSGSWQPAAVLGRARFDEALREAEAARLVRLALAPRPATLRQRLGRALTWIGAALAGPGVAPSADGR
jgi:hypothetical protein